MTFLSIKQSFESIRWFLTYTCCEANVEVLIITLSCTLKKFFYSKVKNMGFLSHQTWVLIAVLPVHSMTLGEFHDFADLQICHPSHMDNRLIEIQCIKQHSAWCVCSKYSENTAVAIVLSVCIAQSIENSVLLSVVSRPSPSHPPASLLQHGRSPVSHPPLLCGSPFHGLPRAFHLLSGLCLLITLKFIQYKLNMSQLKLINWSYAHYSKEKKKQITF